MAGEATEVDAAALNSENEYWLDYRKDRAFIGSELRNGRFKIDSFVHARFALIYIHPIYMVVMLTVDLSAVYLADTNSCMRWQRGVISWPGVGGARQEEGEYEGNMSFISILFCYLPVFSQYTKGIQMEEIPPLLADVSCYYSAPAFLCFNCRWL